MIDDKEMEEFFQSLKEVDRDLITIEEFKHQIKRVQGTFSENE